MPLFCRHNRLTTNCPICSRELEADLRAKGGRSSSTGRTSRPTTRSASRTGGAARAGGRSGGVVTRRLARAADDGYRNPLAPGLRATADARRLASALYAAAQRLEPPGPHPVLAEEPDLEQASWLAFLLALAGPDAPDAQAAVLAEAPAWAQADAVPAPLADRARTIAAYRAWAERAGSQAAAFTGDTGWSPERRFGRVLERLALPGLGRAARFELLATLGAAGRYPLAADALHVRIEDDVTAQAAKRLLVSGDAGLLERRAADLAQACGLPLAALDRGLVAWAAPGPLPSTDGALPASVRSALRLPAEDDRP